MKRKVQKRIEPHITYLNMGPWPVFVGFTTDEKAFEREMTRLGVTQSISFLGRDSANATTHLLFNSGTSLSIITLKPSRRATREQVAALIAHEASHVVEEIREQLYDGKPLGSEAEAYLIQHIVQGCLQVAWETGRTRSWYPG